MDSTVDIFWALEPNLNFSLKKEILPQAGQTANGSVVRWSNHSSWSSHKITKITIFNFKNQLYLQFPVNLVELDGRPILKSMVWTSTYEKIIQKNR